MMKFDDKIITSKKLFSGVTLDLNLTTLKNEEGMVYERELIKRRDAVGVVAIHEEGVLLVKQFRPAINKPLLEIPAGLVEDNDPEKTAYKELVEEVGFKANSLRLLTKYYASAGYTDEIIYIYEATDLIEVKPEPEEEELIEIIKMPYKQVIKEIKQGKIEDSKTIIGLLLLNASKE